MTIRLLPVVIFTAVLLLTVRVGEIWQGVSSIPPGISVSPSLAQESKKDTEAEKKVEKDTGEGAEKAEGDAEAEGVADEGAVDDTPLGTDPALLTPAEVALLQDLSRRRDRLDERDRSLRERENILAAIEERITVKMESLKRVQADIQALLGTYDVREREKIKSLVKMYEGMKPKDAARIFEKLDLPILLQVIEQMRANKSAAIMAAVDAELARTVTVKLAERAQLPKE